MQPIDVSKVPQKKTRLKRRWFFLGLASIASAFSPEYCYSQTDSNGGRNGVQCHRKMVKHDVVNKSSCQSAKAVIVLSQASSAQGVPTGNTGPSAPAKVEAVKLSPDEWWASLSDEGKIRAFDLDKKPSPLRVGYFAAPAAPPSAGSGASKPSEPSRAAQEKKAREEERVRNFVAEKKKEAAERWNKLKEDEKKEIIDRIKKRNEGGDDPAFHRPTPTGKRG